MKVLLTGSKGFIGKQLSITLLEEGYEVIGYDIEDGQDILNLKNLEETISVTDPDFIFHVAAEANLYGMESLEGAKRGIDINVIGTSNIALLASKFKKKLIYASTMCVYGDTQESKLEDTTKPKPQELYAYTKLAGEQLILGCHKNFDLEYIILRFATVYGPGQRTALGSSIFLTQALKNEDVTVHGDGTQQRTLTHIKDIVQGCLLAVKNFKSGKNQIINLSSDESISANQMAEDIIELSQSNSKIKYIPQRKNQTFHEYTSWVKAFLLLNWSPSFSWKSGIKNTYEWFKNYSTSNSM